MAGELDKRLEISCANNPGVKSPQPVNSDTVNALRFLSRLNCDQLKDYAAGVATTEKVALITAKAVMGEIEKLRESLNGTNTKFKKDLDLCSAHLAAQIEQLSKQQTNSKFNSGDYIGAIISSGPDFYERARNTPDNLATQNTLASLENLNRKSHKNTSFERIFIIEDIRGYLSTDRTNLPTASKIQSALAATADETPFLARMAPLVFAPKVVPPTPRVGPVNLTTGSPTFTPPTNPPTISLPTPKTVPPIPRGSPIKAGPGWAAATITVAALAWGNDDVRNWVGKQLPENVGNRLIPIPLPEVRKVPTVAQEIKTAPPQRGLLTTLSDSATQAQEKIYDYLFGGSTHQNLQQKAERNDKEAVSGFGSNFTPKKLNIKPTAKDRDQGDDEISSKRKPKPSSAPSASSVVPPIGDNEIAFRDLLNLGISPSQAKRFIYDLKPIGMRIPDDSIRQRPVPVYDRATVESRFSDQFRFRDAVAEISKTQISLYDFVKMLNALLEKKKLPSISTQTLQDALDKITTGMPAGSVTTFGKSPTPSLIFLNSELQERILDIFSVSTKTRIAKQARTVDEMRSGYGFIGANPTPLFLRVINELAKENPDQISLRAVRNGLGWSVERAYGPKIQEEFRERYWQRREESEKLRLEGIARTKALQKKQ